MTDNDIKAVVARLDSAIPKTAAVVKFDQYGGWTDESRIIANKIGYLRLGIECLKAAYLPSTPHGQIEIDLKYLVSRDSTIVFDWFERQE